MITERPLLLELLARVGTGALLAIKDYNAATNEHRPYYYGHLDCAMREDSMHHLAYMKRYDAAAMVLGADVVMFDSYTDWHRYNWAPLSNLSNEPVSVCSMCMRAMSRAPGEPVESKRPNRSMARYY